MIAVILDGVVINVGPWSYQLEDGSDNPLPEGAIQGDYDVVQNSSGSFVLSTNYMELRRAEYPSVEDQLDALYEAGLFPEPMASLIKAVKDKYPKP